MSKRSVLLEAAKSFDSYFDKNVESALDEVEQLIREAAIHGIKTVTLRKGVVGFNPTVYQSFMGERPDDLRVAISESFGILQEFIKCQTDKNDEITAITIYWRDAYDQQSRISRPFN